MSDATRIGRKRGRREEQQHARDDHRDAPKVAQPPYRRGRVLVRVPELGHGLLNGRAVHLQRARDEKVAPLSVARPLPVLSLAPKAPRPWDTP